MAKDWSKYPSEVAEYQDKRMSSRTSDLIRPKDNVGMTGRGADLIRRADENHQCELPSQRARQRHRKSHELAVIPNSPGRTALLVLGDSGAYTTASAHYSKPAFQFVLGSAIVRTAETRRQGC